MRVLFMVAELYPFVKTGGLGDIAATLPPALVAEGMDVRLLLPGYPQILDNLSQKKIIGTFSFHGVPVKIIFGSVAGMKAYVVDAQGYYDRTGPYVDEKGKDWPDNHLRFALFCQVGADIGAYDAAWRPDVVHGNDWHCGLMPAYISHEEAPGPATILSIHNIAYQGLFPKKRLADIDLPPESFSINGIEYWGQIGFLKAGLYYADAVSTVSPTYAREIQTAEYGHGLEGLLQGRGRAVSGILNGIDRDVWNPETDPEIAVHYKAERLTLKNKNKTALLHEMKLPANGSAPVFAVISRLTPQKGLDILLDAMPVALRRGAVFVILGAGDEQIESGFLKLAAEYPQQVAVRIGYDEALAHRIQAGTDVVVVPSRFEPCGLVQLYALRYGTLPLVRKTGGLADSVAAGETGFLFVEQTPAALGNALLHALDVYRKPSTWKKMQRAAMAQDFGWSSAARKYVALYRKITEGRERENTAAPRKAV